MSRGSGTGCCTSPSAPWQSRTALRAISARRTAWGSLPWDLLLWALYHTGRQAEALEAARQALALAPEDGRIRDNVAFLAG